MKRLTINIPDDREKLYSVIRYPAGEIQVRLTEAGLTATKDKDSYLIVANPIPDLIELAQLKNALDAVGNPWYWKGLKLPYLPYARADRRFVPGDSHGLAVFGNLLNSLHFDAVDTFDVHSVAAAEIFVNKLLNIEPIRHTDDIKDTITNIGRRGLLLILPDKGAATRYDIESLKLDFTIAEKVRDPKTGKLSGFKISEGVVAYKKALIIDDICDGGGTFIGLGEEIHRLNPKIELYLYVSHGIFSQGLDRLCEQFKGIYISDQSFKGAHYDDFEEVK